MRSVASKVMWVGRATVFALGLAVILAVVLGVATVALAAAPGDPFRLGQINTINALTTLAGSVNNAMLKVDNNSAGTSATALNLRVEAGKAPMKVDSGTKVANLNSDRVDGKSANQLVRVSSFNGVSPLAAGTDGTVATTIKAPASGFLVITAGSDLFNVFESDTFVGCFIEVDNAIAPGSTRLMELNATQGVNKDENCSTNVVVPVSAGEHTVDLEASNVSSPSTSFGNTSLSVIYIPFNGTGSSPSSASISAAQEEGEPLAVPEARK
jgi:hypothetical protein